jgi:hypothetical protein
LIVYLINIESQNIIFYDTIDKRTFYSTKTSNNLYFITGQIYDYDSETYKLFLLKSDILGNYLWHKSYGPNLYEYGSRIIETSVGEILTGGSTWVTDIENTRWYLLKTDTAGNVIWEQAYGRNNYNNGKVSGLIETQDSNYLACGVYPAASYGSETLYDGCLRKIDTAGELLWEKHYRDYHLSHTGDIYLHNSISDLIKLEGSFYILGSNYDCISWKNRAYLAKLNNRGEIEWKRDFYAIDTNSFSQYLVSFKPTNDNGFILAGYGNEYDYFGYDPPQQAWLVKTDSLGMDGLSNTEPDVLQLEMDLPDTACQYDTIPVQIHIAGKSAPYTLSFSTGQVIDSIYYPPTFVPQEVGLGLLELEWGGSIYHTDTIQEATITNHEWGHCIVKDVDFHTPAATGAHELSITLTDVCGETTTINKSMQIEYCPDNLVQENENPALRLFPNPATNKLHLELHTLSQTQQAKIYDAGGKLVSTHPIHTKTTTLDISHLQPGTYILKINGISRSFTVVR